LYRPKYYTVTSKSKLGVTTHNNIAQLWLTNRVTLFCKDFEVLKQYCKSSDLHDKQPTLLPRCEVMRVLFDP